MLENFAAFMKKMGKREPVDKSKNAAKERLHLVLMQDRANVSADFLEMMKQEIVDVIKKYIDVDETDMDVKLENRVNNDGTSGAPALYANIPIVGINEEKKKESEELTKAKQNEEETKLKQEEMDKKATKTSAKSKANKKTAAAAKTKIKKETKSKDESKIAKTTKKITSKIGKKAEKPEKKESSAAKTGKTKNK